MTEPTTMAAETAEKTIVSITQPRAYQLELFEESIRRNVIVTMDTGSGKTQIAKLRIEAELDRCSPEKLVWFLAPTVVLAEQQHKYLTEQLPAYQSRLICGSDNVEHWSTIAIWNVVLRDMRIVVSTSRILLDALMHGFVRMGRIALLVFDEAHHCMRSHDTNRIMQEYYHVDSPATGGPEERPHILGLSASPITNAKPGALEKLEQNLNAICKAPTRHLEELQRYVHQPQMYKLTYVDTNVPLSHALETLQQLIKKFDIWKDPYVRYLGRDSSPQSQRRLQKVITSGSTESLKQLKALHRRTTELHQQIGHWASTYFLNACVQKMREKVARCSNMLVSLEMEEEVFLYQLLSAVVAGKQDTPGSEVDSFDISPKATSILRYLRTEYTEQVTGIIFVKERSTAAILAQLISRHPLTRKYKAQPFVGSSNFARKQTLADVADIKSQNVALADFRSGKNNLLVCTSVMEEGVDISSMNLVIRFDEPANFRAFIQSRGRARRVESRFVLMCGEMDPAGSYQKWKALEAEMKAKYMDEMREIAQAVEDEEMDEIYDEHLSNDTTRARLSIHDAKAHLEHFCACLPTVPYADLPRPEYILESLAADRFKADVVLPHSVNIVPRRISGMLEWTTQKMATKDAAFRAYARLYEAGLINPNFLPAALPDPVVLETEAETEEEASVVRVKDRMNPWTQPFESKESVYKHVLTIRARFSGEEELPCLHLLFPTVIDVSTVFNLFWTNEQSINVQIVPKRLGGDCLDDPALQALGRLSTQRLFESIFLGKMQRGSDLPQVFPFLIMPFLKTTLVQKWLTECAGDTSTESSDAVQLERGLIRLKKWSKHARPFVFRSLAMRTREPHWACDPTGLIPQPASEQVHFKVKRLPKRLDYLHPTSAKDFNRAIEFLPAAECYVDRFPRDYAMLMLLFPSILHKMELRMVTMALKRNVLSPIDFQNLDLVERAICSSAANESSNYQRLELIGDGILKFWTSAQLCAQFPGWHEGYLSRGKDRVVSNSHLCRAAKDTGLDEYIHAAPFAGSQWRPPTVESKARYESAIRRRDLSSKVLADVVEALIGASFSDGKDEPQRDRKVKACLRTLLAAVSWRSPNENASMLKNLVPEEYPGFHNFTPLTAVSGHSFDKKILLIEALTHPSHPPVGIQGSYQRLEFLGDAVLDFIVVETMAKHSRDLSHFTMHLIRAAVVNAHLLAFFCLGTGLEQDCAEVTADGRSGAVEIRTAKKKTYLWEFMKHSGKLELLEAQKACAQRYKKLAAAVNAALDHGKSHPWFLLLSLNAEKFFSDIIESILGAIFIDSNGDLQACRGFLTRLGLLRYLQRIIGEEVDVMHPKERLGIVAGNRKVRYMTTRKIMDDAAHYSCIVFVDDEPMATSTGEVSKAAAETKAAQDAVGSVSKENGKSAAKVDGGTNA